VPEAEDEIRSFVDGKVANTPCALLMSPLPFRIARSKGAHTDHFGRIDAQCVSADALGVLPHAQDAISLSKVSGYRGIARILLERLFECIQTALPLPPPAIDITRVFERLRVVRL